MAHAFVRISGHGFRFLPAAPFVVQARGEGLEVHHEVEGEERAASVDCTAERRAHECGEVFDGPEGPWQLEVGGIYVAGWPTELFLRSWLDPNVPPFYQLDDGEGSLLYLQGPMPTAKVPTRAGMVGPGQREVSRGEEDDIAWIDLEYEHEGVAWSQRHLTKPVSADVTAVVTVQAKRARAERMNALGLAFARSVQAAGRARE